MPRAHNLDGTHTNIYNYNFWLHFLKNLSQITKIVTSYLLGMDCGTGPDRLGYGGCAKGLILKDNEWFSETVISTIQGQYQVFAAHGSFYICISDKCILL